MAEETTDFCINWTVPSRKAEIFVTNIAEALPVIIASAKQDQVRIDELASRKMTLDDLFISMTGRHLNE